MRSLLRILHMKRSWNATGWIVCVNNAPPPSANFHSRTHRSAVVLILSKAWHRQSPGFRNTLAKGQVHPIPSTGILSLQNDLTCMSLCYGRGRENLKVLQPEKHPGPYCCEPTVPASTDVTFQDERAQLSNSFLQLPFGPSHFGLHTIKK